MSKKFSRKIKAESIAKIAIDSAFIALSGFRFTVLRCGRNNARSLVVALSNRLR